MDGSQWEANPRRGWAAQLPCHRQQQREFKFVRLFLRPFEELPTPPENSCLIQKGEESSLSGPDSRLQQRMTLHTPPHEHPGEGFTVWLLCSRWFNLVYFQIQFLAFCPPGLSTLHRLCVCSATICSSSALMVLRKQPVV